MFISRIQASADDRSPFGDFWFTPVGVRTATGLRVTPGRAMALPIVLACVRVRSESFAMLPLRVYRRNGKSKELVAKHWLYDLMRRPNPFQTGSEWRKMIQSHIDLRGNAYNLIQTDRRGNIVAFMPLHPDRMKVVAIGEGDFDYRYEYAQADGTKKPYARDEIWHLRALSTDGIVGLTPIELARDSVALGLAAQEYGSRFFQNDAKPGGGWIETQPNMSFKDKAAKDQFRESWQEAQTGMNRHKMAVLEYGMKYHELGLKNNDSQFLESRQFQVGDIARMFRIPPHKVGDLSKATFANIEQQSLEFVLDCMSPVASDWQSSIECNLLLEEDADICVEFDVTVLLRGDQVARSTYYHNGIMDGWMTRNDARAHEGEEPLPGLDKPLMPLNMVAIDETGEQEAPPPDPNADPPKPATVPKDARMQALIASNATRMARRIAGGNIPSADVLADAMATSADRARTWLAMSLHGDESAMRESLIQVFGSNE